MLDTSNLGVILAAHFNLTRINMNFTFLHPLLHGLSLRSIIDVEIFFLLIVVIVVFFLFLLNCINESGLLIQSERLLAHSTNVARRNEALSTIVEQCLDIFLSRKMSVTLLCIFIIGISMTLCSLLVWP